MNKYKIRFIQSQEFIVDVYAENEEIAEEKAQELFNAGDYQETGDLSVSVEGVYDVTDTDDPFYPSED